MFKLENTFKIIKAIPSCPTACSLGEVRDLHLDTTLLSGSCREQKSLTKLPFLKAK